MKRQSNRLAEKNRVAMKDEDRKKAASPKNRPEDVDDSCSTHYPEEERHEVNEDKPEHEQPEDETAVKVEIRKRRGIPGASNDPTVVPQTTCEDITKIIKTTTVREKKLTYVEPWEQRKSPKLCTQKNDGQNSVDAGSTTSNILWAIFYILFITALVAALAFLDLTLPPELSPEEARCSHFLDELSAMQEAFPSQTARFWKLLRNPTKTHLNNTSPLRPLVIMLVASPGSSMVMQCIAKKLAYAIDRKFNANQKFNKKFEIFGGEWKDSDGDEAKRFLDVKLGDHFSDGNNVAVIHNLELLPAPSPLIFYSYCDDQNAAYKKSAIIFTVQLPQDVPEHLPSIKRESFVTDFLKNTVWSGNPDVYGEDRIAALLSRITTTIAIIQKEESSHIEKVCPMN